MDKDRILTAGGKEYRLKERIPPREYQAWADSAWADMPDGIAGLNHVLAAPVTIDSFDDIEDYLDLHRAVSLFFGKRRWAPSALPPS